MMNLIPLPGFAISEREAMALGELDTLCELLLLRYDGEHGLFAAAAPVGAESGHAAPTRAR